MKSNTNVQEKAELKKAVSLYCVQRGISKADFAVKVGVSSATLSNIENERWEKVSEAMCKKIWSQLKKESTGNLYNTIDFESVCKLCESAQKHHLMIGLIGDTGTGKTTSLTAYSKNRNVYRITFEKSMNPKQFFITVLKEMGVDFEGGVNAMINRLSEELNSKQSPLVIIDEAGKITHTIMLYLHDLREKTKNNCWYVLAGMPYFKTNLQKFSNKTKEGYSEFYRRINLWHTLEGLNSEETEYICRTHGINDPVRLRELSRKRRFGDLMNEILLDKVIREEI